MIKRDTTSVLISYSLPIQALYYIIYYINIYYIVGQPQEIYPASSFYLAAFDDSHIVQ